MSKKFFSGNSIEQAVLAAARQFQLDPEEVAYTEVDRRHGFLRVRRRAVISVDAENPKKTVAGGATGSLQGKDEQPSRPESAPSAPGESPRVTQAPEAPGVPEASAVSPEREPDYPDLSKTDEFWPEDLSEPAETTVAAQRAETVETAERGSAGGPADSEPATKMSASVPEMVDEIEAAQEALRRLLVLTDLDLNAEVSRGDERLEIELRGEDEERLLEDRGRLLLAIQHLLPRMLRGLIGRSVPCFVDCDNFHEIRAEQLRDLAQRVASQVRHDLEIQTLDPMSPDERRIVHVTLSDDPAVETVSRGQGLFKRIQVRPIRLRPQGFDPYNR